MYNRILTGLQSNGSIPKICLFCLNKLKERIRSHRDELRVKELSEDFAEELSVSLNPEEDSAEKALPSLRKTDCGHRSQSVKQRGYSL